MHSQKIYPKQFWQGIKYKIPLCCILFYESAWHGEIKKEITDFSQTMEKLTDNQGIILCPECVTKKLSFT